MAKTSTSFWVMMQRKRWPLTVLLFLSVSTIGVILVRSSFESCSVNGQFVEKMNGDSSGMKFQSNPLGFMKSKLVLLVSHELSLSGTNLISYFYLWVLRKVLIFLMR